MTFYKITIQTKLPDHGSLHNNETQYLHHTETIVHDS